MSSQKESVFARPYNEWFILLLLVFGVLESCFFLNIQNGFWFDDDATLFAFVSTIHNPLSFFISKKVISASGFSLTPMQMFSYWLDYTVSGTDAFFPYCHNIAAFLLSIAALFMVLKCWAGGHFSFIVTLAWMLLPSTIAVLEFIGARHYMEGLLFSCLSVLFSHLNINCQDNGKRVTWLLLSLIFLAVAMLFKELYVTSTFTALFLIYFFQRRFVEVVGTFVVGVLYAIYRIWAVGLTNNYPTEYMGLYAYLEFLKKTLYIFSGNYLGYVLAVCLLLYSLVLIWKKQFPIRGALIALLFIIINLATIYPGSFYLSNEWQSSGTWYRLPFLLNFIALLSASLLFSGKKNLISCLMVIFLFCSLIFGADATNKVWRQLKNRYSVTGHFYIAHPNQVVYSELPAYWYLGGLKSLYHLNHQFVLSISPQTFKYSQFQHIREIWRYNNGVMIPDNKLWCELMDKYH